MQAFVHISGDEPGLIPWGYFQNMIEGVKAALDTLPDVLGEQIFSEWLYELYLDELLSKDFNTILLSINTHLLDLIFTSASFANFWNQEIIPLVEKDPRYQGVCFPIEASRDK